MKRNMFGALMTLIVAFTVAVPTVHAQSQIVMSANVPFAFSADGKQLPAGEYEVRDIGARATLIETKDGNAKVFDKVGDHYFLREIWTSARGQGLTVPESKLEKEIMASNREPGGSGAETVV